MMKFIERFDQHKLHYILTHQDMYVEHLETDPNTISPIWLDFMKKAGYWLDNKPDYFGMCKKYLRRSEQGKITVRYI